MAEHGCGRSASTTAMPPNTYATEIHVRMLLRQLLYAGYLIRNGIYTQTTIAIVVKGFTAIGIATAFDGYHNKP